MADTRPSTAVYERARKVVRGWLRSLHPDVARAIHEDDGGQLLDSIAWEIDDQRIASQQNVEVLVRGFMAEHERWEGALGISPMCYCDLCVCARRILTPAPE